MKPTKTIFLAAFAVKLKVYEKPADVDSYLDPTLFKEAIGK